MHGPTPPGNGPAAAGVLAADQFAAMFTAAAPMLWTLAAGVLGHTTGVDDVLQDAARIGLQKRAQFTPGTSFPAWIGRIVRFVAQNERRRARRRRTLPVPTEELEALALAPGDGPSAAGDHAFDDALLRALAGLQPIARTCLLLKVVDGHDYDAIAALLRIPAGTAMSHVSRARARLRRLLGTPPSRS